MLNSRIIHWFGTRYSSYVGWEEIDDDDHFLELDKEVVRLSMSTLCTWLGVSSTHTFQSPVIEKSTALQFAPDKKDKFNDEDYLDFDPEASVVFPHHDVILIISKFRLVTSSQARSPQRSHLKATLPNSVHGQECTPPSVIIDQNRLD